MMTSKRQKMMTKWPGSIVTDILTTRNPADIQHFRHQPIANKMIALENAVLAPKHDDTSDKITSLIRALVDLGAILPDEAGALYSDLLIRVHKYSGATVQESLDTLMRDVRNAQSEAIRSSDVLAIANQTLLNTFLNSLPPAKAGQQDFEAFKQTLRLFCNEAPNVTLYMASNRLQMQVNIRGITTVDLPAAFDNLQGLWGVEVEGERVPQSVLAELTSNSRVLLLLLAPFTNPNTFSRDSLISLLFDIYRETVSASLERPGETESEVATVARQIGTKDLDLRSTLGYLIKNKSNPPSVPRALSPRQEQVLRFMQESLIDKIDRGGMDPVAALDTLHLAFSPAYYEAHGAFIRRMTAYMLLALHSSPSYFREIYSNKYWQPPASFWTRDYNDFFDEMSHFPSEESRELEWDEGSEDYLPTYPRALLTTTLSQDTKRQIERAKDKLRREATRQRIRRIQEANAAIDAAEESDDDVVIEPLLGEGVRRFEHLRSKTGVQL